MVYNIEFTKEQEQVLREYAETMNESVESIICKTMLEKLEDEYDNRVAEEAWEEFLKNPVTYTFEEVMEELGL